MRVTYAAVALALAASTGCLTGESPRAEPATCPATTLIVDAVRGDVNTTFLRATLTVDGKPGAGNNVDFRMPDPDDRTYWGLGDGTAGKDGVAYSDLGALVLANPDVEKIVATGDTINATYVGPQVPGTDDRCQTSADAAFAPAKRTVSRPSGVARSRAELFARLRAVAAAIGPEVPVPRLPDGSSACRLMYAAVGDAERHPEWLGETAESDLVALREGADHCTSAPLLAAQDARRVLPPG